MVRVPRNRGYRNYVFTLNNYTQQDIQKLLHSTDQPQGIAVYIVFQEETGNGENGIPAGTPHLQGYIELKAKQRLENLKAKLSMRGRDYGERSIYLAQRMGSQAQAIAYSKKTDTRTGEQFERGTKKRSVHNSAVEAALAGVSIKTIMEEHTEDYLKHHSALEKIQAQHQPTRDWKMELIIYYGQSGSGKTVKAWQEWPDAYDYNLETKWWEGYHGQETVIIDEFRCDIKFGFLLKLFDTKKLRLNVKYSHGQFSSKRIVLTTNMPPETWYMSKSDEDISPLRRRLTQFAKIYRFGQPNEDGSPVITEETLKARPGFARPVFQ